MCVPQAAQIAYISMVMTESSSPNSIAIRHPSIMQAFRDTLMFSGVGMTLLSEYSKVDVLGFLCGYTYWTETDHGECTPV